VPTTELLIRSSKRVHAGTTDRMLFDTGNHTATVRFGLRKFPETNNRH